ncbi:MAG: zinc ribbon domain-containing protein [Ignavibacteriales bacterium]|nr:zinc ribbon domain-containing protein [Ignavibacteriales bacterium]
MPTYEYICSDCNKRYDVFHKVREVEEDVICPSCGSRHRKRLMSVTSMTMAGTASSSFSESTSSCESGSCCGGACSAH